MENSTIIYGSFKKSNVVIDYILMRYLFFFNSLLYLSFFLKSYSRITPSVNAAKKIHSPN
ncbi:MAG: hypothetical protein RLZZ28_1901 [Bacteroidota bacterium]|jgi:hypothetical protein